MWAPLAIAAHSYSGPSPIVIGLQYLIFIIITNDKLPLFTALRLRKCE